MEQELRSKLKHGDLDDKEYKILSEFRDTFYAVLNSKGINIDDLIS
jgi:hypothetical protein